MRFLTLLVILGALLVPSVAPAAIPAVYKNCTASNKKYPHGVGKLLAKDKTKSGDPVRTFKRSTLIFNKATSYNKRLDDDKDGIACEKK